MSSLDPASDADLQSIESQKYFQAATGSGDMPDLDYDSTLLSLRERMRVFQRYTLQRMLGRGGMGIVWLARDERLDLDLALKFLPENISHDPAAFDDLRRETRRCMKLHHTNIVHVYDLVNDQRTAAIAMEFVDGKALSALRVEFAGRVFETSALLPLIRQTCEALTYAHETAKIVHHDLKPANLMLTREGILKVMDFGIASNLGESLSRLSRVERHSGGGTLPFMSPQQLMGYPPSVSDDVYALGATIYDLLTGKPPFFSGSIERQVENVVPPSMAQRCTELNVENAPPISEIWERTVAACLEKEAEKRPKTPAELWNMLNASPGEVKVVMIQLPLSGKSASPSQVEVPAAGSRRTSRTLLAGSLAAAVLIAGLAATYWWQSKQPSKQTQDQPPAPPSIEKLVAQAGEAATRGDDAAFRSLWQDLQPHIADQAAFLALPETEALYKTVAPKYRSGVLGDRKQAAVDFLPLLELAARRNDAETLGALIEDVPVNHPAAGNLWTSYLNLLKQTGKTEQLMTACMRAAKQFGDAAPGSRARNILDELLSPLVTLRERKPRSPDEEASLKENLALLEPRIDDLAALQVPSAIYLKGNRALREARYPEAQETFQRAAKLGHAPSMTRLGMLLSSGPAGVKRDDKAAAAWFEKAAQLNDAKAWFLLGECYFRGIGVIADPQRAQEWLNRAAREDIAEAHYLIGSIYLGSKDADKAFNPGLTGQRRIEDAKSHLELALGLGENSALANLAQIYIQGMIGNKRDIAKGISLLEKGATLQPPIPACQALFGGLLLDDPSMSVIDHTELIAAGLKPDPQRAKELLKSAARAGDEQAIEWCRKNGVTP